MYKRKEILILGMRTLWGPHTETLKGALHCTYSTTNKMGSELKII